MKNALILHGKPKKERYLDPAQPKPHQAHWLPWLAQELEKHGVSTEIPAFPEPYAPDYGRWHDTFQPFTIGKETSIIGHSAGAGFAVRWLSEHRDVTIDRLVLVAPWHDAQHEYGRAFFDYEVDCTLAERVGHIALINSVDDGAAVQESVQMLRAVIAGISYTELSGYGHFMLGNTMTSQELPVVLTALGLPEQA